MPGSLGKGRLEAFSDGVFAIAITLLVLEIAVPSDAEDDLLRAFFDQWPSYLAYIVSFATIGAAWLAHSAITDHIHRADTMFVRVNLLLLLLVSFLPFPTKLLAEYIDTDSAERVATTIFGLNLLLIALVVSGLWRYAVGTELIHPDADETEVQILTQRLTPGLAGYVVMILLGLVLPVVAVFGYLVIALALIVPFGLVRRRGA